MKIGMALSGGGARGIAHLGVLKALEEVHIKPNMLTGTSAGSIVGAFYANGFSPEEILKIIIKTRLLRILRPAFTLQGLISLEATLDFFKQYLPGDSFEALQIPLFICATNVKTGKPAFFSSGSLIRSIIASSAIPVLFNPVEINGEFYIDGGVTNNMAVEPLVGHNDKIVGVHCNPVDEQYEMGNMRGLLERTFILTVNMNVAARKNACDIFLEPYELRKYAAFDFDKADELFRIGYDYTRNEMPGILKVLKDI